MTPRERAGWLSGKVESNFYIEDGSFVEDWFIDDVERHIKEAVAQEREEIAKWMDKQPYFIGSMTAKQLAQAIRKRGENETS